MNYLAPFRHILVIEDQKARRIVALEEPTYSMGRESTNEIVIYDQLVSRHHATLLRVKRTPKSEQYTYRIIDGDLEGNRSTNGIMVNGITCEEQELKHGDTLILGSKAKLSYYIISNSLSIDLFNPDSTTITTFLEASEPSIVDEGENKSTMVPVEEDEEEDVSGGATTTRLASFPELSPNPIIEMDFTGKITYLNPSAHLVFENIQEEQGKHPLLEGLLSEYQSAAGNLLLREVKVEDKIFEQYVHYLSDLAVIRSYVFDITERKQSEEKLAYQAFHDTLTDLPNRFWFDKQLTLAVANAKRSQTAMAVIFIDLDGFKNINDTLGHSVGDEVLKMIGKRLSSCLRAGDTVARWGGDEFTILLPFIKTQEDSIKLAKRINEVVQPPLDIQSHQLYVKCSMGISIYPQDGETVEEILKNADGALYRAKERGKNQYRFYSTTITTKASLLMKLEVLLHEALEKEEFTLAYQPQVKLKSGEIVGMEALLRWYHPEMGQVSPTKLIPLAEQTDLIAPIGEWVIKTACKQSMAWQKAGITPLPIAVNFSPRQFQQPNLVEMIAFILDSTGLDPKLLEVEITETSLIQDEDFASQALHSLRRMGIKLSLDDFGTGYASLNYLQKFPFNTLKIAQSFTQSMKNSRQNLAIISAMIALGRSLNLRVIAEGVETLEELELLQRLHCEEAQGYWFSRPLKAQDATELLIEHFIQGKEFQDK